MDHPFVRWAAAIGLVIAVAWAGYALTRDEPGANGDPAPVRLPRLAPADWHLGANLTAYAPAGYQDADGRLDRLESLGFDAVSLVPLWYMDAATASAVHPVADKTVSDASIEAAAARAHELGFEVAIAPHVNVADGTFRGAIDPADPRRWFASYADLLAHYADLAERIGAERLVIATELESMSDHEARFRGLISAARTRFSGELTYGANWIEEAERVEFWDALDLIGIDAYMPLVTESPRPSVAELREAWTPYVQRADALHERWDRTIEFTELGYEARAGAAAAGGHPATGPPSERAQATAYRAAFAAWRPEPWFRGIWWWDFPPPGGPADGFSPLDKTAEHVLAHWQGGIRPAR